MIPSGQAHRDGGPEVTDRMRLSLAAPPAAPPAAPSAVVAAGEAHREVIMAETLAVELQVVEGPELRIDITA
jgi:hypothetical protein